MSGDKTILYGLTTASDADWRDKIEEIKELKLTEIALFPTTLSLAERQEMRRLLETTTIVNIPYVHLTDDFTDSELDYFITKYKTKVFSCHASGAGYALLNRLPKYNSLIYVENPGDEQQFVNFSLPILTQHQATGLCLDLAHVATMAKASKKNYNIIVEATKKLPIGVNHVCGVRSHTAFNFFHSAKSHHHLDSLSELDYLRDLPNSFFAKYICMELENSLLEQKEVKQYLELIINA